MIAVRKKTVTPEEKSASLRERAAFWAQAVLDARKVKGMKGLNARRHAQQEFEAVRSELLNEPIKEKVTLRRKDKRSTT